ncbi:class I SAM-dependent methyltransferase [Streptomyces lavendulae]|uniref:class I SAM-dependent methyltransferase n=1 Tax=Streptomyces lavendulae TaxID=1914 RepID=UPI0031E79A9C
MGGEQGMLLLERACEHMRAFDVAEGMRQVYEGLRLIRESADEPGWRYFAEEVAGSLGITRYLNHDPVTRHSGMRPRGYPGDAELIDMVYGYGQLPRETSCLGAAIYAYLCQSPGGRAVRRRRDLIAGELEQLAAGTSRPAVLAVACGHLRETRTLSEQARTVFSEFVALDQDGESLARARSDCAVAGLRTVHSRVRDLVTGDVTFSGLDFVYATGLYDYLPDQIASALTARLFSFLRPGGRLLVANFLPGLPDRLYMEAFMNWRLIYRPLPRLSRLADAVPETAIAERRLFCEETEMIGFLSLTRC